MRRLPAIVAALGFVLMPLAAPFPAAAAPTVPSAPEEALPWSTLTTPGRGVQLLYRGGLSASGTVADSSGHDLDGTIETGGGGSVTSVAGRFLRFPGGSCPVAPCPQAIVRPSRGDTLVPGDGIFSFGADVRLTEPPSTVAGMNVFQFGAAGTGLQQWKLQVDSGRPSCRWSDGTAVVLLPADLALVPGTWYRVRCTRLSASVFETRVVHPTTGRPVAPPARQTTTMGPIVPTGAPVIAGKRVNAAQSDVDTDQFHGDLDNVYFWRA
ncbi:hypothetical protein GCM10009557_04960 [Virgisporangium ochraceum]|uniref:Uncharacterized protein n=1 Tax=Virgisporangium ochraceum TaxID=65505 RepID=A0A8J4EFL0_9ACTN|nr:hypothetical protein [Virgisporangium ochraceum]GIJ70197.1 hypothetical protein Voc01_051140 [Virgisporangium ochraceum]